VHGPGRPAGVLEVFADDPGCTAGEDNDYIRFPGTVQFLDRIPQPVLGPEDDIVLVHARGKDGVVPVTPHAEDIIDVVDTAAWPVNEDDSPFERGNCFQGTKERTCDPWYLESGRLAVHRGEIW